MNELEAVYELIRTLQAQTEALQEQTEAITALAESNRMLLDFLVETE